MTTASPTRELILTDADAARRMLLLAEFQAALRTHQVHSVLARRHRLVLRSQSGGPGRPSGLTDPQLHVFTPSGTTVATTDGITYSLASGPEYPASDPSAAAALISRCPIART